MSEQLLTYRGYHGTVEYSLEDQVLYGKVIDIKSLISYEGVTIQELTEDFKGAVDDYLALCKEHGEKPEKPFSGSFNVRTTLKLHHKLVLYAQSHHLDKWETWNQLISDYYDSGNMEQLLAWTYDVGINGVDFS